jgi:hypothetical protein
MNRLFMRDLQPRATLSDHQPITRAGAGESGSSPLVGSSVFRIIQGALGVGRSPKVRAVCVAPNLGIY